MSQPPVVHPSNGFQRTWVWRGWKIRYSYLRARDPQPGSVPILLLHGFGSALDQWQSNLVPLSQTHTVYAIDLLGFGASEKAPAAYKTQLWVDQIRDFWQSLIGQPVILVGHSLGAVIALAAAVAHPELLSGLILLTLPPARQELIGGGIQSLAFAVERWFAHPFVLAPAFWLIRQPRVLRAALRLAYVRQELVTESLIQIFTRPTSEKGASGVFFRLAKARTFPDYAPEIRSLLPQLQVPLLLLWGESDRVVPLTQAKGFIDSHPNLELEIISNAGHCLYDECAEVVNHRILSWIEELPQSQR